ncbi:hypothetical protein WR25_22969 [Diploscapter pachys]|uniref:LRRNT domain-containing protein n=1 Tax=Diploscapter pachys TaxID=2018661 RepID=A0A2A2JM32_9BILA|nr:hypothetical protein WR25_22969 [Diploscapter pachys]
MSPGIFRIILVFLLFYQTSSCPQLISKVCQCEDLHNGVILDCSHINGTSIVEVLRKNQASLGLIQALTLRNASLQTIPSSFFAGLYIKKLDMSFNGMQSLDDHAFSGMSPVLQELILHHNNLTRIPVGAIGALPSILRLDLSNNSITDIDETDAFPSLSKVSPKKGVLMIPSLVKLYDVNLGSNRISVIHTNIFASIKNSLQTINLGHNRLNQVPSSAIRGLKQVQSLHMHHNNITALEALNFLNLPVLNLLNLAGNKINELNRQAFLNVPNLRYLYLTDNKISTLYAHQFTTFEQLEMLDLTGNLITEIPKDGFSQLSQLRQLYLGNNHISKIAPGAFTNSSIVILVLNNNLLTELPEGIVDGLMNLQQVSFKHNQLKSVNQNAFYNAPSVVIVDLSENELMDVPADTFLAQLNLLLIDLSKNKLIRVPYAAFNRRIGTVLLQENPLVCTEKIHILQDGVGAFLQDSEDLVCGRKPKTTTTVGGPKERPRLVPTQAPAIIVDHETEAEPTLKPILSTEEQIIPVRPKSPKKTSTTRVRGPHVSDISHIEIPDDLARQLEGLQMPELTKLQAEIDKMNAQNEANQEQEQQEQEQEQEEGETGENLTDEAVQQPIEPIAPSSVSPPVVLTLPSVVTEPTPQTKPTPPRPYDPMVDDPNIIHPFPVPFLKRGPQLHKAQRIRPQQIVTSSTSTEETVKPEDIPTLPPSIVIAPGATLSRVASKTRETTVTSSSNNNEIGRNLMNERNDERIEQFALNTRTELRKKESTSEKEANTKVGSVFSPTAIIVVCLSTVGLVMVLVFIGLCIARHKQGSRFTSSYSDSSTARTNAYVAAQQAQMNMIYGSMTRSRTIARPDEQPWTYNPGTNYCNYYK